MKKLASGLMALAIAAGVVAVLMRAPDSIPPEIRTLGVPGRSNAHVSVAAEGPFVAVVWSAAVAGNPADIVAAVSADGGATFGAPVQVNAAAGDASVNGEQPPRLALVPRPGRAPEIVVAWTARGNGGTPLRVARSTDGGRTFEPDALVTGTDAPGNRGWYALHAAGEAVSLVWLDHRQLAAQESATASAHGPHAGHAPAAGNDAGAAVDGVAMAQLSQLYFDRLDDDAPPAPVTGGVCYCCKTAVASAAGALFIAWRHVYPGNLRDIAFTSSRDGGRTFAPPLRVSEDRWMLDGCPDDGPAMAVDGGGRVHVVWPTVVTGTGEPAKALFHAMSADGGRTFTPRQRVPTGGNANHPQIAAAADGTLVLAWDETVDGGRRVMLARGVVDAGGRLDVVPEVLSGEPGVYPAVVTTARGVLAAWSTGGSDSSIRLVTR